jgi:hypothetical protein
VTETSSARPAKSGNFAWLCTLVSFDAVILAAVVLPERFASLSIGSIATLRSVAAILLPVVPLLLTNVISQLGKARLVFWRWRHPYPGSRAFSHYIYRDDRINREKLRRNIGEFPTDPQQQNSLWYQLYRRVQNDHAVLDAHRAFLLFRDISALSMLLLILSAATLYFLAFSWSVIGKVSLIFLIQTVLAILSARVAGERFVCTVLSIHSTKKITK